MYYLRLVNYILGGYEYFFIIKKLFIMNFSQMVDGFMIAGVELSFVVSVLVSSFFFFLAMRETSEFFHDPDKKKPLVFFKRMGRIAAYHITCFYFIYPWWKG